MNITVNENEKETSHPLKGTGGSLRGSNLWGLHMNSQAFWSSLKHGQAGQLHTWPGEASESIQLTLEEQEKDASDEVEEQPSSGLNCVIWGR